MIAPTTPAGRAGGGFLSGIRAALDGLAMLVTTPTLWGWGLAPLVATAWLLVGLLALYRAYAVDPVAAWARDLTGGAWGDWAATVLVWALAAVVLFFAFATMVRVVAAPLLLVLADRTVARVSGAPAPAAPGGPVMRWVLRPLAEAGVLLAIRLAITIVALPLLFVPVAGTVLFGVVTMGLLGLDLLDIAQSARGVLLGPRLRFARSHLAACLGLGVGAGLLLLIPCVNLVLLPAVVVAGVLLDSRIAPDFPRVRTA